MQLQDSFKVPYYVAEFDADHNQALDAGDSATVTSADTTKATVVPDAAVDPAKVPTPLNPAKVLQTGFVVGGSTLGDTTITTSFTHTDGTPAPPDDVQTVTIVSGPPVSGGLAFGPPVAQ